MIVSSECSFSVYALTGMYGACQRLKIIIMHTTNMYGGLAGCTT